MRNCSELYFGEKRQWRKHQVLNVRSICCGDNGKYGYFVWKADNILKLYTPFSLKTRKLRFHRISCFFFEQRHQQRPVCDMGWSATVWPEVSRHWLPQSSTNKFRQKNGGARERLSRVYALPFQLLTKAVISGEAFYPSVYTYSGFWRSDHPLGCHRGWKNSTTSMMVNVSLITDL